MAAKLKCEKSDKFIDHSSAAMVADLSSAVLRLSMQRFIAFWKADCKIGPKKCDPKTCCYKTFWSCSIEWTIYDRYDFLKGNPLGWFGVEYDIYGYDDDAASGTIKECPKKP